MVATIAKTRRGDQFADAEDSGTSGATPVAAPLTSGQRIGELCGVRKSPRLMRCALECAAPRRGHVAAGASAGRRVPGGDDARFVSLHVEQPQTDGVRCTQPVSGVAHQERIDAGMDLVDPRRRRRVWRPTRRNRAR